MGTWDDYVRAAQQPAPVDNFVRLLRHRLTSGCQVVRIRVVAGSLAGYEVLLNCQKELTPFELPHSEAFTAWSLEAGVRMETKVEESSRFRLVLDDRLRELRRRAGPAVFDEAFLLEIRSLDPPRTNARISRSSAAGENGPPFSAQTFHDLGLIEGWLSTGIRGVLDRSVQDLASVLRYSTSEAAEILDLAIEQLVAEWFEIKDRPMLPLP